MLLKRIIPSLILKNKKLIHRCNFNSATDIYVGDPINVINIFNKYQIDEMILIDVSINDTNNKINFDFLKTLSGESFFPLAYGGGINNLADAKKIISCGYEKIVVNSILHDNPNLVKKIINEIGSQSVVAAINICKHINNYHIYDYRNKNKIQIPFEDYINNIIELNPGEILITNVDDDGSMSGINIEFINFFSNLINRPIIYRGGSKNYLDFKDVLKFKRVNAITSSSVFIMKKKDNGIVLNYPNYIEKLNIYGNM